VFRLFNWIFAAVFLLAVVVQYNDPDPLRWMAIYGAACALSAVCAVRGRAPRVLTATVAVVAVVWGLDWALDVSGISSYLHMFDAWEMKSPIIEEAREASGLFIVAGWMLVLFTHATRGSAVRRKGER
jgi:hypothetical protein